MKKGAIFDMDGTLFDTESLYRKAWLETADIFGLERNPELGKAASGSGVERLLKLINDFYPTVDAKEYLQNVAQTVEKSAEENLILMPGVTEILNFFRENGVKMTIASSSPVFLIKRNLKKSGLEEYFGEVCGGDIVENGKPAPDIFLLAAEKLNLNPKDCYVFEDSYNGIRGAAAAGCSAVMVVDTAPATDEMKNLCVGIFDSLTEVLTAIKENKI